MANNKKNNNNKPNKKNKKIYYILTVILTVVVLMFCIFAYSYIEKQNKEKEVAYTDNVTIIFT